MFNLIKKNATDAFNAVGAKKSDGSDYKTVQGLSVSANGCCFRFWEEDVIEHNDDFLDVRRRPLQKPDWVNGPNGSAFFRALEIAKSNSSTVFGTINKRGKPHPDGTSNAVAAASILTMSGRPASGTVLQANARTGWLHVRFQLNDGPVRYIDQHLVYESRGTKSLGTRVTYSRDEKVRMRVLHRARGVCEGCGERGFDMGLNRIYLETHHIAHRSVDGPDSTSNVVAVCANCHRKAHWSVDRDTLIKKLLSKCRGGAHPLR